MRILFDHGTPRSIARWLQGHIVVEAIARGWDRLTNGELLKAAEEAGFDILLSISLDPGQKHSVPTKPPPAAKLPPSYLVIRSGPRCTAILIESSRQ
jgi:hypothetical protein